MKKEDNKKNKFLFFIKPNIWKIVLTIIFTVTSFLLFIGGLECSLGADYSYCSLVMPFNIFLLFFLTILRGNFIISFLLQVISYYILSCFFVELIKWIKKHRKINA